MGLLQKQVAKQLGVDVTTVTNWELNRTSPARWFVPGIIRFLGHAPSSTEGSLPARLKTHRRMQGLSQKRFAAILGVDPSTLARWETGKSQPDDERAKRIKAMLFLGPS